MQRIRSTRSDIEFTPRMIFEELRSSDVSVRAPRGCQDAHSVMLKRGASDGAKGKHQPNTSRADSVAVSQSGHGSLIQAGTPRLPALPFADHGEDSELECRQLVFAKNHC